MALRSQWFIGLRGLPEEAWVRQALQDAQAFLDQGAVAQKIRAKLNRLLFGFLEAEVLQQAMRVAELGIDPTPSLEVVATHCGCTPMGWYAPAMARTDHAETAEHPHSGCPDN